MRRKSTHAFGRSAKKSGSHSISIASLANLIAWAQKRGDARSLVERLFHAYFIEGRFVGDRDELVSIAVATGLPESAARGMLESDQQRAEVEAESREAQGAGITGVPFFIFNGRTAVSGAHDPPMLLEAIGAARAAQ